MASRADRAKIFLPFNPLRGFQEALEAQERVRIPRPELSDDAAEALDRALRHLRPGDTASVLYYARCSAWTRGSGSWRSAGRRFPLKLCWRWRRQVKPLSRKQPAEARQRDRARRPWVILCSCRIHGKASCPQARYKSKQSRREPSNNAATASRLPKGVFPIRR